MPSVAAHSSVCISHNELAILYIYIPLFQKKGFYADVVLQYVLWHIIPLTSILLPPRLRSPASDLLGHLARRGIRSGLLRSK